MLPGMAFSISDLAVVRHTLSNLKDLIEACRPRGSFYQHDKNLTNAVIREAKGLQTSLGHLQRAAEDPGHKPHEPAPSTKEPLATRLYLQPHLYELARFVSYGGKRCDQMRVFMKAHREKHGDKSIWALHELTTIDKDTNLTVLRPQVIRACRVLLGPVPGSEEYPSYWARQGCEPPADHLPPGPEPRDEPEEKLEAPKKRGRAR